MQRLLILTIVAVCSAVRPAVALVLRYTDGSYQDIPNDWIFWAVVFVVAGAFVTSWSNSSSDSSDAELHATGSAEEYEEEAARYRALSRKLDAETDLAESLIKAKRTRAELEDAEELFRENKSRRRR